MVVYVARFFWKHDTDKSGRLGIDEFKQEYDELFQTKTDKQDVEKVLIALDANKSGDISFSEFVDWLKWV
jgi:Ca2+-binding EF-hand superfamily protein